MSDEEDYSSEDDEDYVPTDGEAVSEEDNSGDEEDLTLLKDDQTADEASGEGRRKKSKKKATGLPARKRAGGIKLEDEEVDKSEIKEEEENRKRLQEEIEKEKEAKKEEQTKKRADDLWANFMSDVGGKPKAKPATKSSPSVCTLIKPVTSLQKPTVTPPVNSSSSKVTITKTFDFAGESVKVSKEVDADSKEAKQSLKEQESTTPKPAGLTGLAGMSSGSKRPGGGLGGLLDKLNKKPKISTLDKSKLDWEQYKEKEGISAELSLHHKGKESYLERKAFLERSDLRQFEIEKNIRLSSSKR